ncbi:hypothetical protein C3B55_00048 [Candidatus Pseudomonas adelgestsugas]|uniref:Uncharacterized protein n=1 Tax=Candidatus Pseudomonas adelgestsugas TaxID=1302376 RepID=A0ABX5R7W6_9PSED|nr:hypothetical protein C3B55_00048 [Candidatus Pseudomonas adelgestsugas]
MSRFTLCVWVVWLMSITSDAVFKVLILGYLIKGVHISAVNLGVSSSILTLTLISQQHLSYFMSKL